MTNLEININDILKYMEVGRLINEQFSLFNPGIFSNKNDYETSFAKKCYFNDIRDYYISVFISHINIHAFYDGNKRKALHLFKYLLIIDTQYFLLNIDDISLAQLLHLEKNLMKKSLKQ